MKTASRARCRVPEDPQLLQDAILMLESRLRSLGDGDCAYEKAMIRFYEQQLVLYRARQALQAATPLGLQAARLSPLNGTA
jgi:hypothetical protein